MIQVISILFSLSMAHAEIANLHPELKGAPETQIEVSAVDGVLRGIRCPVSSEVAAQIRASAQFRVSEFSALDPRDARYEGEWSMFKLEVALHTPPECGQYPDQTCQMIFNLADVRVYRLFAESITCRGR